MIDPAINGQRERAWIEDAKRERRQKLNGPISEVRFAIDFRECPAAVNDRGESKK